MYTIKYSLRSVSFNIFLIIFICQNHMAVRVYDVNVHVYTHIKSFFYICSKLVCYDMHVSFACNNMYILHCVTNFNLFYKLFMKPLCVSSASFWCQRKPSFKRWKLFSVMYLLATSWLLQILIPALERKEKGNISQLGFRDFYTAKPGQCHISERNVKFIQSFIS